MSREQRRADRVRRRVRMGIRSYLHDPPKPLNPNEAAIFQALLENDEFLDEALDHLDSNPSDVEVSGVMRDSASSQPPRDWKEFFHKIGQAFLKIMPYFLKLAAALLPTLILLMGQEPEPKVSTK